MTFSEILSTLFVLSFLTLFLYSMVLQSKKLSEITKETQINSFLISNLAMELAQSAMNHLQARDASEAAQLEAIRKATPVSNLTLNEEFEDESTWETRVVYDLADDAEELGIILDD